MSRRIADERGFMLMEALIVMLILGIVLAALTNTLVSGERAQSDFAGRVNSQQDTRVVLDRLDYEARCATSATLVSGGAGVQLSLPSQCSHGTGTVTWCVVSGTLYRYAGAGCSASGEPFVRSLSSATPFALSTAGDLPLLQVTLVANTTGRGGDGFSLDGSIALRNA